MEVKFFICKKDGNVVAVPQSPNASVPCCEKNMKELIPGTTDAAQEKHVPVAKVSGSNVSVTVGSVLHPMEEKHYIQWIWLQTKKGIQQVWLKPNEEPKAVFSIAADDSPVAVYEYCNLHGLWKTAL